MCFSATADLTAAALVAPVGVAALRLAPTRADLPIAALPLLFAVHQGVEAFVWLGLEGRASVDVMRGATVIYLLLAQVVLPLLVPLGVWTIETVPWRRRALLVPIAAGVAVAAWVVYVLNVEEVAVHVHRQAVVYETDYRLGPVSTTLYAVATVGAVVMTSRRELRIFGLVNAAGFVGAALVRYESVTSVWCVYAALTSVVVLLHLAARRREERAAPHPRRALPSRA